MYRPMYYTCRNCGKHYADEDVVVLLRGDSVHEYCPHCGAILDGTTKKEKEKNIWNTKKNTTL